jgi:hypothetical protein
MDLNGFKNIISLKMKRMKRVLLMFFLAQIVFWPGYSQEEVPSELTIVAPAGLEDPYEVNAGTIITYRYSPQGIPDMSTLRFFSHSEKPADDALYPDPAWTVFTNYIDNGNGTFDQNITTSAKMYVWVGYDQGFAGWRFSNVIEVNLLSGVTISVTNKNLCPGRSDTRTITVEGSYSSYKWYFNNKPISEATSATYDASESGFYKVEVLDGGNFVFSNTIKLSYYELGFTGQLSGNNLTMTAKDGMDSYQWYSGTDSRNLAPIDGAATKEFTVALTDETIYYSVEATIGECTLRASAREASSAMFAVPLLTINTPPNENGLYCEDAFVSMSVPDTYEGFKWFLNGELKGLDMSELYAYANESEGTFTVSVSPLGWPEISLSSNAATVNFYKLRESVLVVENPKQLYCPGDNIRVMLGDEGYPYVWYVHKDPYSYTEQDRIDVVDFTHTFTFEGTVTITVVAADQGCEKISRVQLNGYETQPFSVSIADELKGFYVCSGTATKILLTGADPSQYEGFQWYKYNGFEFIPISGAQSFEYLATTAGQYKLEARNKVCNTVPIKSYSLELKNHDQRSLYVNYQDIQMCEGESITMTASVEEWTNFQWFKRTLTISQNGQQYVYVPFATGAQVTVDKYNGYILKATHKSCTSGAKISSDPVVISPRVTTQLTPDTNQEPSSIWKGYYGDILAYLYCEGETIRINAPEGFDSYKWFLGLFTTTNVPRGTQVEGENQSSISLYLEPNLFGAKYLTLVVEKDGCIGETTIIIDTRVQLPPIMGVESNGEICDSKPVRLFSAFDNHNIFARYEWYKNGELISGATSPEYFATEPGLYNLAGYAQSCPEIALYSHWPIQNGFPVDEFPLATLHINEEVIYAMPELGTYFYEWYLDGVTIPHNEETPWMLPLDNLEEGIYTVRVSNENGCSSISDPFPWIIAGTDDDLSSLTISPNPASHSFTINDTEMGSLLWVVMYDIQGHIVQKHFKPAQNRFDISSYAPGIYVVEIIATNGVSKRVRIVHN